MPQQQIGHHQQHDENDDRIKNACHRAFAQLPERSRKAGDSGALCFDQHEAAHNRHRAERRDQRIDLDSGDDESVDQPDQRAAQQPQADRRRSAITRQQRHARRISAQRQRRTDRQIEPAGDDDERHANRHQPVRRNARQNRPEIIRRQKAIRVAGLHGIKDQRRHQHAEKDDQFTQLEQSFEHEFSAVRITSRDKIRIELS